jgi:hypothetical protein
MSPGSSIRASAWSVAVAPDSFPCVAARSRDENLLCQACAGGARRYNCFSLLYKRLFCFRLHALFSSVSEKGNNNTTHGCSIGLYRSTIRVAALFA